MDKIKKILDKDKLLIPSIFFVAIIISFTINKNIGFWARDTSITLSLLNNKGGLFALSESLRRVNCFCIPVNPFIFLEISTKNLRLLQSIFLALGAVASFFLYRLVIGSKKLAIVSVLVLVTTPFYIATILHTYPFLVLFSILSSYFILKYINSRKNIYMYLAVFILGLGISNRLNLLYFIPVLLSGSLFIGYKRNINFFDKNVIKLSIISITLFLIATIPITRHLINDPYSEIEQGTGLHRPNRGFIETFSVEYFLNHFTKFSGIFLIGDYLMVFGGTFQNIMNRTWRFNSFLYMLIFLTSILGYLYGWSTKRLNNKEKYIFLIFIFFFIFKFLGPTEPHSVYYHPIFPLIPIMIVIGLKKINKKVLIIGLIILFATNSIRLYQYHRLVSDEELLEIEAPAFNQIEGKVINHLKNYDPSKLLVKEGERVSGINFKLNRDIQKNIKLVHLDSHNHSQSGIYQILIDEVINNTHILLPKENWKNTDADKILYNCKSDHVDNLCDNIIKSFNNFINETNFTNEKIDNISSSKGTEVYHIHRIIKE